MKIEYKEMSGIMKDGTVKSGGAVETEAFVRISKGKGCRCCMKGQYYISIGTKVVKEKRKYMSVRFDDRKEMEQFLEGS